ncbi:hypothetical protein [Streptomyces niveus]|uniref:hypothetical protein n=1 Tax=Streptomyces niveus TaxID=193462 RepID=UPI0036D42A4E
MFACTAAGVANRADGSGTTFLDRLSAGAPFPDRRAFLRAVATTVREWESAGLLSRAEAAAVTAAATAAPMRKEGTCPAALGRQTVRYDGCPERADAGATDGRIGPTRIRTSSWAC